MSDLNDLARLLSGELHRKPIDEWKVRPGVYKCPDCDSHSIARERSETTRYWLDEDGASTKTVDVEREIRCMDCGFFTTE